MTMGRRTREYLALVIPWLPCLCLLVTHVGNTLSDGNLECSQTICEQNTEVLGCLPSSQILINDVTSLSGETDDVMLSHVTRACMGHTSCNVSVLCKSREENASVVSYYCVQNSPDSQKCKGSAVLLTESHGFLQNPDYPAPSSFQASRGCHWRIQPRARQAVHLQLLDLTSVHRTQGRCDGGLTVSLQQCNGSRQTYPRLLCADEVNRLRGGGRQRGGTDGEEGDQRDLTLVSCGPVDIRLTPARQAYPLRFWLGYAVTDSSRTKQEARSLYQSGLLAKCVQASSSAGSGFEPRRGRVSGIPPLTSTTMTAAGNNSVASVSGDSSDDGASDQGNTMTVLIVLVCVIGVIALVLSVILVVVCIRRRRPKVELIEHVYAVPANSSSACQALSHNYLDDHLQPPPPPPDHIPRPRLVQAYCDVADARPMDQGSQGTPASPAYAEVEEVDCPADGDKGRGKRFHFRFRSKRPSVSSTGGLYEDINPLPLNSASRSNAANAKCNTLPKNSGSRIHNASAGVGGHGAYSTGVHKGGRGGFGDSSCGGGVCGSGDTSRTVRESPVYVHVVDSPDVKSSNNCSTGEKSGVAPLAAKFIASIDKTATGKGIPRGKTDNSARLYPLQEGRVATLVSTLNRKKDTVNGVNGKDGTEQVS